MKKSFIRNFTFLFFICLFTSNLFAQGLPDPGKDPIDSSNSGNTSVAYINPNKNKEDTASSYKNLISAFGKTCISDFKIYFFKFLLNKELENKGS